jgi:hypothetical protein
MNQPASHKCDLPRDHQEYQKRDEDERDDGASRHAQVIVSPAPAEQIVSGTSLLLKIITHFGGSNRVRSLKGHMRSNMSHQLAHTRPVEATSRTGARNPRDASPRVPK